MPKLCCGKTCTTNFCPECGEQIHEPSPVLSLLAFIRGRVQTCVRGVQRRKRAFEQSGDENKDWHAKRLASAERVLEKWGAWCSALEALVSPDQQPSNP